MSQSDYIQYKSLKNDLLFQKKLDPILDAQDYTRFVKYSIESTIPNTKLSYNQLIPPTAATIFHPILPVQTTASIDPDTITSCYGYAFNKIQKSYGVGKQLIFNIEQTTKGCPTFIDCSNTNIRPNRVLTRGATAKNIPITPVPKYVKIKPTKKCSFNTKYRTRICICDSKMCKCGINICSSK
jgi:hypothetical protein